MTSTAQLFGLQTNWEVAFDCFPEFDRVEDQAQSQDTRDGATKHGQTFSFSDNGAKDTITANQELTRAIIAIHTPKVTTKVPGEASAVNRGVTGSVHLNANRIIMTNQFPNNTRSTFGGETI